jgi:hypothetical protein
MFCSNAGDESVAVYSRDEKTGLLTSREMQEQILDNIAIVGHTSFTPEELDAIDQITL